MFYKVLKSDSLENLENQVNEYINNGFLLQGGIYVDTVFMGTQLVTLHGLSFGLNATSPESPGKSFVEILGEPGSRLAGDITLDIRSTYYQAVSKTPPKTITFNPDIFKVKEAPIVD